MDVSQPQTGSMPPPTLSSPNPERQGEAMSAVQHEQQQQQHQHSQSPHLAANGGSSQPTGAAAAAQQPKVVQTAFIHKLYKCATTVSATISDPADTATVCWKTRVSSISSRGRVRTRAS